MTYPRINTTQLQHILSGKVQIETFSTLKDYSKSIFVSHNNSIYYSLVDISAGPFKPSQWQKVILLSDFDTKQDLNLMWSGWLDSSQLTQISAL